MIAENGEIGGASWTVIPGPALNQGLIDCGLNEDCPRCSAHFMLNNLNLYVFPAGAEFSYETVLQALSRVPVRPCGPLEMSTLGFESIFGESDDRLLMRVENNVFCFMAAGEEKSLLNPVLRKRLAAAIQAFEVEKNRRPTKSEQEELKNRVINAMTAETMGCPFEVACMIDLDQGWLAVGALSGTRSEAIVSAMRLALRSFPARPAMSKVAPQAVLTDWLLNQKAPEPLELGQDCDLVFPEETTRCWRGRRTELIGQEVQTHLAEGMRASLLGLVMGDASFSIDTTLRLRSLKVLEPDQATNEDENVKAAEILRLARTLISLLPFIEQHFGIERPTPVSMEDSAASAVASNSFARMDFTYDESVADV